MASLRHALTAALLAASVVGPVSASAVQGSPAVADEPLPIVKGLSVSVVARPPSGDAVRVSQPYGRKGPTSIRFFPADPRRLSRPSPNPADPPGSRYLVKDRDLGQTFRTPPGPSFRLDAVTLRVGPAPLGDVAGIAGAAGAPVFLQVFEVAGAPTIHDNGTTGTTTVSASYPGKAMADDYVTGETYRTLLVATGGALPPAIAVGESNTAVATLESAGTLLRFDVTRTGGVTLQPGRQYAFMVGFESAAAHRALPIDNYDYLNQPGVPEDSTAAGPYAGGHAIRREGRVERPQDHLALALSEDDAPSRFPPDFAERLRQQPGTWGRPDVDTYRDLAFWLEGTEEAPAAAGAGVVRTGFGSNVVRPGAYGQAVSIQLFRVTGAPVLHDNGTTGATQALHGFPHDRRDGTIPSERDDYLTGETYAPLLRAAGARFPSKGDFGFTETASVDPNHARLKGRYLRWDLEGASEIVLEPGGVYAFLVLIDEIGEERGLTLANSYRGGYEGGHGIRRDGILGRGGAGAIAAKVTLSQDTDTMAWRSLPLAIGVFASRYLTRVVAARRSPGRASPLLFLVGPRLELERVAWSVDVAGRVDQGHTAIEP